MQTRTIEKHFMDAFGYFVCVRTKRMSLNYIPIGTAMTLNLYLFTFGIC